MLFSPLYIYNGSSDINTVPNRDKNVKTELTMTNKTKNAQEENTNITQEENG